MVPLKGSTRVSRRGALTNSMRSLEGSSEKRLLEAALGLHVTGSFALDPKP